jgi:hypothetical protein
MFKVKEVNNKLNHSISYFREGKLAENSYEISFNWFEEII